MRSSWLSFLKLLPPTMYWRGSIVIARVIVEVEVIGETAVAFVISVIGVGIVGVVGDRGIRPVHVGAGIGHVEVADLAFDRQRDLRELVLAGSSRKRCVSRSPRSASMKKTPLVFEFWCMICRRDGPIVVEVDLQRGAAAVSPVGVEIVFDELGIVDVDAVAHAADGSRRRSSTDRIAAIGRARRRRCRCSRRRAGRKRLPRNAILSAIGRLIMPSRLPPMPPCATVLSSPSTRPVVTPSSGLLVMMRIVPAWLEAP